MKKNNEEMRFDEIISKAADFGKVEFDAQKWKEKYLSSKSIAASRSNERLNPHKNFWRIIMENRVTKYSAAAVVAMAITLVLLGPFGTPGNGNVVLAEVQQNVDSIKTMIIRGTKTFTSPGEPDNVLEFGGMKWKFDLVKYLSQQYGLVEEGYIGDELVYRITMNRPKQQTLIVLPRLKKYGVFTSTEQIMHLLENGTPRGIIRMLMGIDYEKLGKDNINGEETEVFKFQDPVTFTELMPKTIFDIQNIKGKVWIAIKEQIPVRVEGDMVIGKSFMTMFQELNLHEVNTLGDYDIELDENIFDITPPEGYTEFTLSDILQMVPTEAKAGAAAMGVIPAGFVFWRLRRKKKLTTQ